MADASKARKPKTSTAKTATLKANGSAEPLVGLRAGKRTPANGAAQPSFTNDGTVTAHVNGSAFTTRVPQRTTGAIKSMCVYCGSGPGKNPAYVNAARVLGRSMAEGGIGLVYGGGSLGLMGETAKSVLDHGGHVTGIIPQFLSDKEKMLRDVQELHVVEDMHTRKRMMFERSDAFVALPGGIGTLEELVEQLTWAQLGRHRKPIILVNIDGFWQPFLSLLAHMRDEAFIRAGLEVRFVTVTRADDVIKAAEAAASDDANSADVLRAITQQF